MKKLTLFLALCTGILLTSCSDNENTKSVIGLRPIYGTIDDIQDFVKSTDARELISVGKIYTYQDFLFINEVGSGLHVYNNQDPKNPVALKFISIPGNVDIAIKNQYIYADLGSGIITIDMSNLDELVITDFSTEYLEENLDVRPPQHLIDQLNISGRVYYECIDRSNGKIITWEKQEMPQPECYIGN
tara:strand:- start:731 stop:1294 length:564 start_codon:yes stop_codon:yes gene_type:complete